MALTTAPSRTAHGAGACLGRGGRPAVGHGGRPDRGRRIIKTFKPEAPPPACGPHELAGDPPWPPDGMRRHSKPSNARRAPYGRRRRSHRRRHNARRHGAGPHGRPRATGGRRPSNVPAWPGRRHVGMPPSSKRRMGPAGGMRRHTQSGPHTVDNHGAAVGPSGRRGRPPCGRTRRRVGRHAHNTPPRARHDPRTSGRCPLWPCRRAAPTGGKTLACRVTWPPEQGGPLGHAAPAWPCGRTAVQGPDAPDGQDGPGRGRRRAGARAACRIKTIKTIKPAGRMLHSPGGRRHRRRPGRPWSPGRPPEHGRAPSLAAPARAGGAPPAPPCVVLQACGRFFQGRTAHVTGVDLPTGNQIVLS